MKKTIGLEDFMKEFNIFDRYNSFGYDGLKALYNYILDIEECCGEEFELDVIAICCDYTYYENIKEFRAEYGEEYSTIEDIESKTDVIKITSSDSFIIQNF